MVTNKTNMVTHNDIPISAQTVITAVIADKHPVISNGIRYEAEKAGGIAIVGMTDTGDDVLKLVKQLKPDVLILDIPLIGLNGIQVAHLLQSQKRRLQPPPQILVFSEQRDKHHVWSMLAAGAMGYMLKNEPIADLINNIKLVACGRTVLSLAIQSILVGLIPVLNQTLSDREQDVMVLVGQGYNNRQISKALQISEATVSHHITNAYHKLPTVRNRAEAVAWARINQLMQDAHNLDSANS